ncbi:NUDIX hydrolase [Legionella parisiensis]|uniref:Putative Nudix hydrolase NudL n=1 Tax=Legionella parisiensis TaxID=45071 RepID=A0A1E5JNN0_9GAMM|nr:CoA pyrophosphatase [Legionella parisiensis]KTD41387.1 MutT/nudix family transporter protein [Legionella parisiensis]OEH46135.1 putative Nudix hydrolase NudL [Legionella parisiensis]STX76310.1 MutT/nudix family transporter protein [Legionella parisiensis]
MDLNQVKGEKFAHSAVVVLYEQLSDSLILTQRSDNLRAHPGEICFPGGTWEEGDKSYYATALRELHEELGITSERITLIKELTTQKTLLGKIIHPWFASIETLHPYLLNDQEVTRLISIPMALVQDAQNYKDFIIERNGRRYVTCEFTANKDWVWGATARIMKQLIK